MQKVITRRGKLVPPTLTITINERARKAFFSQYVAGFSTTYDVLETLYGHCPTDRHLPAAVDAVSLAFFSFQFSAPQALSIARERYAYALPLLNEALASSETATSDSTLLAVLLMDLYEKITNNKPPSEDSWMSHVNGALALVKLRDHKQFQDQIGLRLSIRLSFTLGISVIAANVPVPPELVKLRTAIQPFVKQDDQKWLLSGLGLELAILRSAILYKELSESEIIDRATDLDYQFMMLDQTRPPDWHHGTTFLDEKSERVLEQHFDTYADHFITQVCNVVKILRIMLNNIIRTHLRPNTNKASDMNILGIATNKIDNMAKKICASIPQYTGHETTKPKSKGYSETERLQCYTLFFPLYTAGMYASPETKIKTWIIEQLWYMSNELRVRNASVVAGILESGPGMDPWALYAMMGSYAFAA